MGSHETGGPGGCCGGKRRREKRKFAVPSQWRKLLEHRNFSPRLVENTLRLLVDQPFLDAV